MIKNYIENANFEDTGFSYTLSLISGKHKMVILYCLMEFEVVRFNELRRYLKNVSDKTLSNNLKELEADRLIIRKEYLLWSSFFVTFVAKKFIGLLLG